MPSATAEQRDRSRAAVAVERQIMKARPDQKPTAGAGLGVVGNASRSRPTTNAMRPDRPAVCDEAFRAIEFDALRVFDLVDFGDVGARPAFRCRAVRPVSVPVVRLGAHLVILDPHFAPNETRIEVD